MVTTISSNETVPTTNIDVLKQAQLFLGELQGRAHIYTFTLQSTTSVSFGIFEPVRGEPLQHHSALLVRMQGPDQPVKEIGWLWAPHAAWAVVESPLAVSLLAGPNKQWDLPPGEYLLEVSAPDNTGGYILALNETMSQIGFWQAAALSWQLQRYFGFPLWHVLLITPVAIAIALLVVTLGYLWYRRRNVSV